MPAAAVRWRRKTGERGVMDSKGRVEQLCLIRIDFEILCPKKDVNATGAIPCCFLTNCHSC